MLLAITSGSDSPPPRARMPLDFLSPSADVERRLTPNTHSAIEGDISPRVEIATSFFFVRAEMDSTGYLHERLRAHDRRRSVLVRSTWTLSHSGKRTEFVLATFDAWGQNRGD